MCIYIFFIYYLYLDIIWGSCGVLGAEWKCLGCWKLDLGQYPPPSFLLGLDFWDFASFPGSAPGQDPAWNAAAVLTIIGLNSQLKGNLCWSGGVEQSQAAGTPRAPIPATPLLPSIPLELCMVYF